MEERIVDRKGFAGVIMLLAVVLLLLGMAVPVRAGDYKENRTGSISLNLKVNKNGAELPLSGVTLALYQVAGMDTGKFVTYTPVSAISGCKVDLNSLYTAADTEAAGKALAQYVTGSGLTPMTAVTDADGHVVYQGLSKGMYLVVQAGQETQCTVSPMLLSVPYAEDGENWEFDIQAYPKAEVPDKTYSIEVTKRLKLVGTEEIGLYARKATYYVRLFLDEAATVPYGEAKAVSLENRGSQTVKFTGLPAGIYYVRETDASGNPVPTGVVFKDANGYEIICQITVGDTDTTKVTLDAAHADTASVVVNNSYPKLPDGYYVERLLTIHKKVLQGTKEKNTSEKFYATVMEVNASGDETKIETVELKVNGDVTVMLPMQSAEDANQTHTYRVYESDSEGNAVNTATFPYEVSGEGDVVFEAGQGEASIEITNKVKETKQTETEPPVTPSNNNGPKTGDTTPVAAYAALLGASAVLLLLMAVFRRKKNR